MSDQAQSPVKVSQAIIDYARDAKSFIRESGEDALPQDGATGRTAEVAQ